IGAIIAPVQLEKIQSLVKKGVEEGAVMWQPSWSCPTDGLFYPPTLFTDVTPAATVAQVEIFGPVVVLMTFRTPAEAVEMANNTRYGLAASVWSENLNTALDIAPQLKAGTVWVNCTNLFDAASGFGGYRESGYGGEGGKEGLWEYLKAERREDGKTERDPSPSVLPSFRPSVLPSGLPPIDRTPKLYIGRADPTPFRNVTLSRDEPFGVLGLVAPSEAPLLGFLSLVLPAAAMGNCVVAVPSERWPLLATDLYQVLDTSDLPAGVVNIVTGTRKELAPVLAAHDDVDGIWFFGPREEATEVERLSTGNMKRTWAE